ncbi:hypothetical protein NC653_041643 [Populus alba x Populus x berolinensis]|uniref:Uncharacterized protein n=1 Tax=Populus alba x Populus x berolinensis TaxID=444605 RepID=A0AAD6LA02_9ROSI|nr:hypothetical protein NC653_041643 [Populus alba x Populus x berolinensis]
MRAGEDRRLTCFAENLRKTADAGRSSCIQVLACSLFFPVLSLSSLSFLYWFFLSLLFSPPPSFFFLFSSLPNLIVDFLGIYSDLPSLPQPTSLLLISLAWGVSFLLRLRRQQYAWTVGGRPWPGFQ